MTRPDSADPTTPLPPILVEVTRGDHVESQHRGHAVVVDGDGRVLRHWGDFERAVFPRSAIKPLQAIPLVESGAWEAFGLDDRSLALACASHSAEPVHAAVLEAWLERLGLEPTMLACGADRPLDSAAAEAAIAAGQPRRALDNNCSGKHLGMLTTARHKGEPTAGYERLTHPVQQRILGILEQATGHDLSAAPVGIDGCSVPSFAMPLGALALAMARMAAAERHFPPARAVAVAHICRAWGSHPKLVAGSGRFDTAVMTACRGRVLSKCGAEGVSCAVLPANGLGVALKIEDGSDRARDVAMAVLLRQCGVDGDWDQLQEWLVQPLRNKRGLVVGVVRATPDWPG